MNMSLPSGRGSSDVAEIPAAARRNPRPEWPSPIVTRTQYQPGTPTGAGFERSAAG
ncbi:hypothetical protein HMPREF0724_11996 [Prescottella equi ATCC 33707]|uniref:Uncharacterized protein n=1 Tax=Prescottella equi ATCC 33707 TaxID=525370 RepID=F1TJC3_RHOHA|nr:hypothetical protein HMPREF0724_11996 [Prescottella equi ATCC 33707]